MKKVIKEDTAWESYDQEGLDIASTDFAAGLATYLQRYQSTHDMEDFDQDEKLDPYQIPEALEDILDEVLSNIKGQVEDFMEEEDDIDLNAGARYESTQYDNVILESNKWMYGEVLNEAPTKKKASTKKKIPYVHKGKSSFTIKKIGDTYGTDKLKAQAEFEVYVSMFESSKDKEGLKTSNLSTTLMDKKAYKSNLKDGKFITLKGDPADAGFKRKVLEKDFSKVLEDVKELRSDYLKGV